MASQSYFTRHEPYGYAVVQHDWQGDTHELFVCTDLRLARWLAAQLDKWAELEEIETDTYRTLYEPAENEETSETTLRSIQQRLFDLLERPNEPPDKAYLSEHAWFGPYEKHGLLWLVCYLDVSRRHLKMKIFDYDSEVSWLAYRLNAVGNSLRRLYDKASTLLGQQGANLDEEIFGVYMDITQVIQRAPPDNAIIASETFGIDPEIQEYL